MIFIAVLYFSRSAYSSCMILGGQCTSTVLRLTACCRGARARSLNTCREHWMKSWPPPKIFTNHKSCRQPFSSRFTHDDATRTPRPFSTINRNTSSPTSDDTTIMDENQTTKSKSLYVQWTRRLHSDSSQGSLEASQLVRTRLYRWHWWSRRVWKDGTGRTALQFIAMYLGCRDE